MILIKIPSIQAEGYEYINPEFIRKITENEEEGVTIIEMINDEEFFIRQSAEDFLKNPECIIIKTN